MMRERFEFKAMAPTGSLLFAAAVMLLGSAGCGDGQVQDDNIETVRSALGSTWPTPVQVRSWTDLTNMASDGNYILTVDLDGTGKTWALRDFGGTLDGGGHRISNLTINDSSGRAGAFFQTIDNAIIKNLRLLNIKVTGNNIAAGLAGLSSYSTIDRVAVEGTISGNSEAGGMIGRMTGGTLTHSYVKGTVNGGAPVGGLVADQRAASIVECYAQATVTANTSNPSLESDAGGLVGYAWANDIHDSYAVGNVTGRGAVGGIVGFQDCDASDSFLLYKALYRGDVKDVNLSSSGGWAGTVGKFTDCVGRWEQTLWDNTLDPSTHYIVHSVSQKGASTTALKAATTPNGGQGSPYCLPDVVQGRCGDNSFAAPPWDAGTSTQYHILSTVTGPNVQPR